MGYKELDVWKLSIDLVVELYQVTGSFPDEEKFGLTSQIRRAAVSVPANIAEGYGRRSPRSYSHFLRIAKGSINELETLLIVAAELDFLGQSEQLLLRTAKIGSMLTNLSTRVEGNIVKEISAMYGELDDE